MAHMDQIDGQAQSVSSVNTVVKDKGLLMGSNTDALGEPWLYGRPLATCHTRALVLGSGPAARSIACGLSEYRCQVDMGCRDARKAASMLHGACVATYDIRDVDAQIYDVIINATSSDAPIEIKQISPTCLVVDINYMEGKSLFLRSLAKSGIRVADGRAMLVHQAALQQNMRWQDHKCSFKDILDLMSSWIL
jgi:shikimate dehydrogenase